MRNWYVKLTAYLPYPVSEEFRITASNMGTALSRAVKEYRGKHKGRKINQLEIVIRKI